MKSCVWQFSPNRWAKWTIGNLVWPLPVIRTTTWSISPQSNNCIKSLTRRIPSHITINWILCSAKRRIMTTSSRSSRKWPTNGRSFRSPISFTITRRTIVPFSRSIPKLRTILSILPISNRLSFSILFWCNSPVTFTKERSNEFQLRSNSPICPSSAIISSMKSCQPTLYTNSTWLTFGRPSRNSLDRSRKNNRHRPYITTKMNTLSESITAVSLGSEVASI